jgi:Domain of unknown function (DUF6487)
VVVTPRRRILFTWLVAGLALAGLAAAAARPLLVGWRCYALHARGEHVPAEVIAKLEPPQLALRMLEGGAAGQGCTAKTSLAHHAALREGDVLAVVYGPERPGACELEATLVNSLVVLGVMSGGIGLAALAVLVVAIFVHRSFSRPGYPTTHLAAEGKAVLCPACGGEMAEGYLVPLAGLHWRRLGEPVGVPHALAGLPGTVGWRGRPRLHAFRCEPCDVVTFRHGSAGPAA